MSQKRNSIAGRRLLGAASALAMVLTVSTTAHAEDQEEKFDIPALPLSEALAEFSRQSKINVVAPSSLTRGKISNAIVGEMEPGQALQALIGTAALDIRMEDDGSLILAQTTTDAQKGGLFRVAQMDQEDAVRRVSDDDADNQEDDADNEEEDEREVIIVTGTNIRGVENPTAPVVSFDRQDIELTGSATIEEFFRTVPQNFGSETPFVDNSQNPNKSRLNTSGGTGVDLRGAGAGSTLVLLNGRRLPPSDFGAFVDVSVLPLSAIERVELQTDGASAIYGSDAVAGVVNFITRKDYQGVEAFARYGIVTKGSLREHQAGLTAGHNWGSGGGLLTFEYTDKNPLFASERDYIEISSVNPIGSLSAEEEKYSAALSLHQNLTNRLTVAADVLHGSRNTVRAQNTGGQFTVKTSQSNWFVTGRLDYDISDRLSAGLYIDYGDAYSTSRFSDDGFMEESQRTNRLLVIEGRTSGELLELPGGEISFALGGLYRREAYDVGKDGTLRTEARREVKSAYGELLIPIIGNDNALPGVQAFDISLAGRYEDYSDFGDSFTPKIGLHWRINNSFALRGTYSESFRAPLLNSTNGGRQIVGFVRPVSNLTVAPAPPQDPRLDPGFFSYVFLAGANADLQPESAKVWTGGFEFQPTALEGLEIEGTYFYINYTDRIESVGFFDVLRNPAYISFLELNPSSETLSELVADAERFLNRLPFELTDDNISVLGYTGRQNVASREISGLDISVSYDWDTTVGAFAASVSGTYLFDYKARITDMSPPEEQVSTVYRPVDLNLRGTLSWSLNGFTAYAGVNYTDGYTDNLFGVNDPPIDEWITLDLTFSYDSGDRLRSPLLRNTKISIGVQNLFDRDPPFVDTADGLNYDPANATPLGRLLILRINKSF